MVKKTNEAQNNQAQNDKQARFLALLEPCHDNLARFARSMTKSKDDARDLVADTIEQAYKHFDSLKSETAFLSWLFTIASRIEKRRRWRARIFQPLNSARSSRGGRGGGDEHGDELALHNAELRGVSRESSPETLVDTDLLYAALERLPYKQREAFTLFEISGFSLQEIQELQGDSLSAVKMRLVRARESLRAMLGDADSENRAVIHHLTAAPTRKKSPESNAEHIRQ